MKLNLLMAITVALVSTQTTAEMRNDIPSCYEYAKVDRNLAQPLTSRSLTVAIDGTLSPDIGLKRSVHNKVHNYLQPGDQVTVIGFSAYVGDNYTEIKFTGLLDPALSDRDSIGKKTLTRFDACMDKQQAFVRKNIDEAIKSSFKSDNVSVPKTELINNISELIAPIVAIGSSAERKLLLVSDMLENSDITSFYQSGGLKQFNAEKELTKVAQAQMLTDFSGANVYVIGAGWLPEGNRGFRGGKAMKEIKNFWDGYFTQSNARLAAFGQPSLLTEL